MPDVVLKFERWKARLKCSLETRTLTLPTFLILWCVERQRDEPFQLRGNKLGCCLVW